MERQLPKLYTEKEAAEILTMGRSTLQKFRLAGAIQFIRINGKDVRYKSEHLEQFISSRERGAAVHA